MRLGGKSTNPALQKKKSAEDMRVIRAYKMWGYFTLACKIGQKIPQYLLPQLTFYRRKTFKRHRPWNVLMKKNATKLSSVEDLETS